MCLRETVERNRTRNDQSFCVPRDDIAAQDYDLSINRYKEIVHEDVEHRSPIEILDQIAHITSGLTKGRRISADIAIRSVPYMAVINVQDRRLDLSTVKTINATELEIVKYVLKPGDLLLTEGT